MEKISLEKFKNSQLSNHELKNVIGSFKLIETHIGPEKNPYYSDVHGDHDNNGKWSEGDTFTITLLRPVE